MRLSNSNILHLSRGWHPDALTGKIAADDPMSFTTHPINRRYFGGNFNLNNAESEGGTFVISFAETTNDMITQCAHDIYSILLECLVRQTGVDIGEFILIQKSKATKWTTTAIVDTKNHLVATGLGSTLDASLCVSSALSPLLCEVEAVAYAIMRTSIEYFKLVKSYDNFNEDFYRMHSYYRGYSNRSLLELNSYFLYTLICYLESYRRDDPGSMDMCCSILREQMDGSCEEVFDIIEMYATTASENKDPEIWRQQFNHGRKWSGLLGYLTWCKINTEELLTQFDMSQILDPKFKVRQAAVVLALVTSGLNPGKYLPGAMGFFAERGKTALLRILLDFGADPNGTRPGEDGATTSCNQGREGRIHRYPPEGTEI